MSKAICLIIQPIHAAAIELLREAGIEPRMASAPAMDVVAREIGEAEAVISRSAGLDRAAMDAAPRLRVIGNHGIGVDPLDVGRAGELGIPIVFTPYANVDSVAEHALALMLAVAHRLREMDIATRSGDFGLKYRRPLTELIGKTLGILGFGRIGRRTAQLAAGGLSMRVLVHTTGDQAAVVAAGYQSAPSLEDLLGRVDVLSLHLPLNASTRGLIGRRELALMKPGAILVNTARGALVDEPALAEALREERLGGAGLDVFSREPLPAEDPLMSLPNVVLTPHAAASTEASLRRMGKQVAEQVIDVLADRKPPHLINPEVWPRRRRGARVGEAE